MTNQNDDVTNMPEGEGLPPEQADAVKAELDAGTSITADEPAADEGDAETLADLFGTDPDMERRGIHVAYGKLGTFIVARTGGANKKYQRILAAKMAPYRRQIQHAARVVQGRGQEKILDEKTQNLMDRLQREAFAEAALLGWFSDSGKNVIPHPFERGKTLEYTQENALMLLTKLPELFNDLAEQAGDHMNYRELALETDAGN